MNRILKNYVFVSGIVCVIWQIMVKDIWVFVYHFKTLHININVKINTINLWKYLTWCFWWQGARDFMVGFLLWKTVCASAVSAQFLIPLLKIEYTHYTLYCIHLRMKALAKSHGHKWLKAYNRAKYKTKPKYDSRKFIRIILCFSSSYLDWETFKWEIEVSPDSVNSVVLLATSTAETKHKK